MYKRQPEKSGSKAGLSSQPRVYPPKKPGAQLRGGEASAVAQSTFTAPHSPCLRWGRRLKRSSPVSSDHTGAESPCVFSSNFVLMMLQIAPKPFLECVSIRPASKSQLGTQNFPCLGSPATSSGTFGGGGGLKKQVRQAFGQPHIMLYQKCLALTSLWSRRHILPYFRSFQPSHEFTPPGRWD